MRYLLKIFSGPHVGAEVLLSPGETIVGSGDDCDVVLDDRLIAERHVAVTIADDAIQCRPLGDDPLLVDGKPVGKTVIRPFQFFTIGTTHLAVGPADKPWPHFDLSDFQLRPPVEDPPAVEEPEAPVEPALEDRQQPRTNQSGVTPPRRRFAVQAGAGLAALLIIVNALLLVLFFNGLDTGEQAVAAEGDKNEASLQQVIRRYEPYIEVKRDDDQLEIIGYVDNDQDRDEMMRDVQKIHPEAVIRVRSTQSLLLSVRRQLQSDGWGSQLHAAAGEPGVVRINGAISIEVPQIHQRWRKTEERIEQDIPLKQLLVEFDEPAENALSKSDSKHGATRTPVPQPGAATEIRGASLPILDVRVSHDKVFTLPNGRQVSIGGRLSDGSRVEEIDLDHAVVRTMSGQRLIVPFGIGG